MSNTNDDASTDPRKIPSLEELEAEARKAGAIVQQVVAELGLGDGSQPISDQARRLIAARILGRDAEAEALLHGERVSLESGQGWQWVTPAYVSRVELHNAGAAALRIEADQRDAGGRFVLRVRAELGEDLDEQTARVNEGLQAAGELARAVIAAHDRGAAELAGVRVAIAARARLAETEPSNLVEDLELLAACAREFTAALDALPYFNQCCSHTGRRYEADREFCSACGAESPAKRWL